MKAPVRRSHLALAISSILAASGLQAATITVNTLDDPGGTGDCSLRQAIESINLQNAYGTNCTAPDGDNDTIVFESGLSGTITLTEGQLGIYEPMSIEGPGADVITIDANQDSRVFVIDYVQASISGLTISGGNESYGAGLYIKYDANVSLSNCVISNNYAGGYGGAIEVLNGELSISNCEITGNEAYSYGGGLALTDGYAIVTDSVFSQNYAQGVGGGIWVASQRYSQFDPQSSGIQGGPYGLQTPATLVLVSSTVSGNTAEIGGGIGAGEDGYSGKFQSALDKVENLRANRDWPTLSGHRGAPGFGDPNVVVLDSTISGNAAVAGGGIGLIGSYESRQGRGLGGPGFVFTNTLVVEDTLIDDNQSVAGGGLTSKYSNATLQNTDVTNNSAKYFGGGIANFGQAYAPLIANNGASPQGLGFNAGFLGLFESTVSGNEVGFEEPESDGRGVPPALGGGIVNVLGTSIIVQSEISGNSSPDIGGGVFNADGYSLFQDSQVSANSGGGIFSSYYSSTAVAYSRLENNFGGTVGGLACVYDSFCLLQYSSVTGNEGSMVGGLGGDIGAVEKYGPEADGQSGFGHSERGGYGTFIDVSNSTISGNSGGMAGGILAPEVNLHHATVAFNNQTGAALPQGGPAYPVAGGVGTADASIIGNSIIARNTASSGPADLHVLGQDPIDMSFSLVEDNQGFTATGSGNIFDEDPQLDSLDFNGSPYSQTHALMAGSPAIDSGDPDFESPPSYDQRGAGFDRVVNDRIDMGAFEFTPDAPEPGISLSPSEIAFGDVLVGASAVAELTISSVGDAPLELGSLGLGFEVVITGISVDGFALDNDTCSNQTLQPTESCTIDVVFDPEESDVYAAVLIVPSNADDNGPEIVPLSGTGVEPEPAIVLSTLSVDFGNVLIGTDSNALVTIESTGTGELEIGPIDFGPMSAGLPTGPFEIFADSCSNQSLAPTEGCTFSVSFQPPARGVFDAMISVPSNAPGSPAGVGVTGIGVAPELSIDPELIDFGTIDIGSTSGIETVELTNTGNAVLNLNSLDGLALPFAANGGTCAIPGPLAIDESCTLGFGFSPDMEGLVSQLITVDSDSLGGENSFTLQGMGSADPVEPPAAPIPVPAMSRVGIALLGGGLMLLGWLGLRRRFN